MNARALTLSTVGCIAACACGGPPVHSDPGQMVEVGGSEGNAQTDPGDEQTAPQEVSPPLEATTGARPSSEQAPTQPASPPDAREEAAPHPLPTSVAEAQATGPLPRYDGAGLTARDVRCRVDADCVVLSRPDCCGCSGGGVAVAVNRQRLPALERRTARRCNRTPCIAVMSNHPTCRAEPRCVQMECELLPRAVARGAASE